MASRDEGSSDEVLMTQVASGSPEAFDCLLARHGRALFNFILRYVGNPTDAEDLLQTTFMKIIQSAPSFDQRQKFTTWAYRIATNLCVDHWRRSQHRKAISLEDTFAGDGGTDSDPSTSLRPGRMSVADAIADEQPHPGLRFEQKQLHAAIRRAVQSLSEEQKAVVLLCHFEGLTYPEVADTLRIPIGTVKSRMHNAMIRLRQQLKEWM